MSILNVFNFITKYPIEFRPTDFWSFKIASFIEDTKRGEHGLTAKYWMQYIEMFHLYHDLLCSVREGDLDIFIHTIPKISLPLISQIMPNGWFSTTIIY